MLTRELTKHEKIKELIEGQIIKGRLKVGERLPSRQALAAKQNVSQAPVRQAIRELTNEGILHSKPGRRGLFVASTPSAPQALKKLSSIAVVYETISDMPQLEHAPLMSQLILTEMTEEAMPRDRVLREMPYQSPLASRNDRAFREAVAEHRMVVFLGVDYLHWAEHLQAVGTHALYVSGRWVPQRIHAIGYDVEASQKATLEHLLALGHRRIAFLGELGSDSVKFMAYSRTLIEHGVRPDADWVQPVCGHQIDGYMATRQLLERLPHDRWPTAIAADTDDKALGAIAAIREAGKQVPHDVSVVGLDNRSAAKTSDPPLTTAGPRWSDLGKLVLDVVERIEEDHPDLFIREQIPIELSVRSSTAPPATG